MGLKLPVFFTQEQAKIATDTTTNIVITLNVIFFIYPSMHKILSYIFHGAMTHDYLNAQILVLYYSTQASK